MPNQILNLLEEWNPAVLESIHIPSGLDLKALQPFFSANDGRNILAFISRVGLENSHIQFIGVHVNHALHINVEKSKLTDPGYLHLAKPMGEKPCQDCGPAFLKISAGAPEMPVVQLGNAMKFKDEDFLAADFFSGVLAGCYKVSRYSTFGFQKGITSNLEAFEGIQKVLAKTDLKLHPQSRGINWSLYQTFDLEVMMRKTQLPSSTHIGVETLIAARSEKRLNFIAAQLNQFSGV